MNHDGAQPELRPATRTFEVRFVPFEGKRPAESSSSPQLQGDGQIELRADGIRLRGKPSESSGLDSRAEVAFHRLQVADVAREGSMVRFSILDLVGAEAHPGSQPKVEQVEFLTEDERSARTIAQFLRDTATEEAQAAAEVEDFEDRLEATGGYALFTMALVVVNVAVFAIVAGAGGGIFVPDVEVMTRFGTDNGTLTAHGQWWRLFTSMFLHFGLVHLVFNMWALVVLGRLVEPLYGSAAFLIIYVAAGLCGSLGSLWWHPTAISAGASGAIFGVYGAMLVFYLRKELLVPDAEAHHHITLIGLFAYNLVAGLISQRIDNAGHIGGLLGGFVLGLVLARPVSVEQRGTSQAAFYIRGLLVAVAIVAGLFLVVRVSLVHSKLEPLSRLPNADSARCPCAESDLPHDPPPLSRSSDSKRPTGSSLEGPFAPIRR